MSKEHGYINDVGDYEQNALDSMWYRGREVVRARAKLGMKIGDFELLSQEERENLIEWELLLEEDVKNDV